MEHRGQLVFLFLILAQGAHSIEEYVTKVYEVFAPARFVSSLVSNDLALGFVVVNAALVTFGLWCWAVPVRSGWHAARGLVWFWTILVSGAGLTVVTFISCREKQQIKSVSLLPLVAVVTLITPVGRNSKQNL